MYLRKNALNIFVIYVSDKWVLGNGENSKNEKSQLPPNFEADREA